MVIYYNSIRKQTLTQHRYKPLTSIVLNHPWPAISDILFQVRFNPRGTSLVVRVKALPFNAGVVGSILVGELRSHDFKSLE